jgi:TPR repeat protein
MNWKQYIVIGLLCGLALLGLVWQFGGVSFLPSRAEMMLRQQIMMARWSAWLDRNHEGDPADAPPVILLPAEAYQRSIDLLSDGRQIEAEEIIDQAVKTNLDDVNLLFAKAVLERSRWDKYAAKLWFGLVRRNGAHTYLAEAVALQQKLDSRKATASDLTDLVRLSDDHPDDIYLLWLSAFQCREQENGELGRQQYEKLLSKFRVGPVLLHQTYANILDDCLNAHEAALKHRYVAVSLEPKGWSLHGLACTLNDLGRYSEASAVLARTVQIEPYSRKYWSSWGWTLRKMGQYEEALEKYQEAYRLDPSSAYDLHNVGYCLELLKRDPEMMEPYRTAAAMGYDCSQYALGWCYENGRGVEKDIGKAMEWYRSAADQGNESAQFQLGYLFQQGIGVKKDFKQAVKWYQLAADQGHVTAWDNMSICYNRGGAGLTPDYSKALFCSQKALEIDPESDAALNGTAWILATCEDESFRDYPKAVELAERAVALEANNFNLDTLAVAYDHNGQYAQAVETQKRLIAWRQNKYPEKPVPAKMAKRLEEFERKAAEAGL